MCHFKKNSIHCRSNGQINQHPAAHLLVSVVGFGLQHLQQAAGGEPACCVDVDHALLQVIRDVHRHAKTHLKNARKPVKPSETRASLLLWKKRFNLAGGESLWGRNDLRYWRRSRKCSPEICRFLDLLSAPLSRPYTSLSPAVYLSCKKPGTTHYSQLAGGGINY